MGMTMRTFWLASYPKSGNTWFRLLVANLGRTGPIDINTLSEDSEIASIRDWFDRATLLPSALMTNDEIDRIRPAYHRALGRGGLDRIFDRAGPVADARFVKAHDAWTMTAGGEPVLGGADAAAGAILIVRDPRAVAPSFAAHTRASIDEAIAMMADPDASLSFIDDGTARQLRQRLLDWGGHAASWLDQRDIPVHLIRYEDLHADPGAALHSAMVFAGVPVDPADCAAAACHSAFETLARQESATGFREATGDRFFRRGEVAGWRDELTPAQIARIEADHGAAMQRFGYALVEGRTASSMRGEGVADG